MFGISESKSITLKVLPYIIIGIAIGAIIHGYAPADFLVNIAGPDNPLAVPIAVLIGIPLYSNAAGMIPSWKCSRQKAWQWVRPLRS